MEAGDQQWWVGTQFVDPKVKEDWGLGHRHTQQNPSYEKPTQVLQQT